MPAILVRKEHIEGAIKKDSHHCMIADAIKDKLGAQYISVDTQTIRFTDPEHKERYFFLTPPAAQQMILKWDRGVSVQPFAFELGSPIRILAVQKKWKGSKKALKKARDTYEAKRHDPMAPRLVKKTKPKVSRFREFGLRYWTKAEGVK